MNSASLCNVACRYDNPFLILGSSRFLAPIDCLKIPAHVFLFMVHKWKIFGIIQRCNLLPIWEFWMIIEDQVFLAVAWFGSSPHLLSPLSRQQVFSFSQSSSMSPKELILTKEGGEGAKWHDREKGWPSINHWILSAPIVLYTVRTRGYSVVKSVKNAWYIRMDPCMANLHFLFPVFCYVPQFAAAGNEGMLFCTCMC